MDIDPQLMAELLHTSIILLISIIPGVFVFWKIYQNERTTHPEKKISNIIISVMYALLTVLMLFLILFIVYVNIRGRWCEGCQEYH